MLKPKVVVAFSLAVAIALVVVGFAWAKRYEPLAITAYYGPGFGLAKEPVMDDNGFLSLLMRGRGHRVGEVHIVVGNLGRWPVTIKGLVKDDHECSWFHADDTGSCFGPIELRRAPAKTAGGYALSAGPFRPIRLAPHATADLWVRFQETCHPDRDPHSGPSFTTHWAVSIVYDYLGVFERSQVVGWPFGVTYVC